MVYSPLAGRGIVEEEGVQLPSRGLARDVAILDGTAVADLGEALVREGRVLGPADSPEEPLIENETLERGVSDLGEKKPRGASLLVDRVVKNRGVEDRKRLELQERVMEGHVVVPFHAGLSRGELPARRGLGAGGESAAFDDVGVLRLLFDDIAVEVEVRSGAAVRVEEPSGLGFQIRFHPGGDDLLVALLVDDVPLGDDPHFLVPELDPVGGDADVVGTKIHVTLGSRMTFLDLLLVFGFEGRLLGLALREGCPSHEEKQQGRASGDGHRRDYTRRIVTENAARGPVLLLSCYELGHQPLGLALPVAFCENAGLETRGIDLAVEPLDEAAVRAAGFIGISVPMHTALSSALELIPRLRALNPRAHLTLYGLYATLNAELLFSLGASSVLSGELEEELVSLARGAKAASSRSPSAND